MQIMLRSGSSSVWQTETDHGRGQPLHSGQKKEKLPGRAAIGFPVQQDIKV